MVQRITGYDDRKTAFGIGQRIGIALVPPDIPHPFVCRSLAGLIKHRWGKVNADCFTHMRGERTDDDTRSARDIQHDVILVWLSCVDDHVEYALVRDHRSDAEGPSLAAELVQHKIAVSGCRHQFS